MGYHWPKAKAAAVATGDGLLPLEHILQAGIVRILILRHDPEGRMLKKIISKIVWSVRRFLLHRSKACKEMVSMISESLDRPFSLKERMVMHFHMLICKWCRDYLYQLKALRKAMGSTIVAESDLSRGAIERITRSLPLHRDEGD